MDPKQLLKKIINRFLGLFLISGFFVLLSFPPEAGGKRISKKKSKVDVTRVLNSKPVANIHKRQARRMILIRGYKRRGFIGEKENGLLAVRNTDNLPGREKKKIKKLLDRENRDRHRLYQIISRADGHSGVQEASLRLNMFRSHLDMDPKGSYYFEDRQWHRK